jgi:hypothetical protein
MGFEPTTSNLGRFTSPRAAHPIPQVTSPS